MNKLLRIWILIVLMTSCRSKQTNLISKPGQFEFGVELNGRVSRLDSIGDYYLIFVENSNSRFKIVSEKVNGWSTGLKIQLDSIHSFKIEQITDRQRAYESYEGKFPRPTNYMYIAACHYFVGTEICTESSFELAKANNVVGLYIVGDYNEP